jgi:hypothetical protein
MGEIRVKAPSDSPEGEEKKVMALVLLFNKNKKNFKKKIV